MTAQRMDLRNATAMIYHSYLLRDAGVGDRVQPVGTGDDRGSAVKHAPIIADKRFTQVAFARRLGNDCVTTTVFQETRNAT